MMDSSTSHHQHEHRTSSPQINTVPSSYPGSLKDNIIASVLEQKAPKTLTSNNMSYNKSKMTSAIRSGARAGGLRENDDDPVYFQYPTTEPVHYYNKDEQGSEQPVQQQQQQQQQDSGQQQQQSKVLFKKAHTCGSLYAKCGCDGDEAGEGGRSGSERSIFGNNRYSIPSPEPPPGSPTKRGSTPIIATVYPRPEYIKRLSNPEISNTTTNTSQQKTVIKANLYTVKNKE